MIKRIEYNECVEFSRSRKHFPRHCSILYWTWGTEILQFLNDPFEGS